MENGSPVNSDDSDAADVREEAKVNQVKNLLQRNKIQLWKSPYCTSDLVPDDASMLELAANLAIALEMDDSDVFQSLRSLQEKAIEKLVAKRTLMEEGTMMLRLMLAKTIVSAEKRASVPTKMNVRSSATGSDLTQEIATSVGREASELRLISGGKVIKEETSLTDQGIAPGAFVMVLAINRNDESWKALEEQRQLLEDTRKDADLLGDYDDFGDGELEIADQNGKAVEFPREEKKGLILAMSLHEKARASIRRKNYDLALVLLLEAVREYEICRSEILKYVDNYGMVNLDIAWCYLKLGNVTQLPDAANRLEKCKETFDRCYGGQLERLRDDQKASGNEKLLYVRMQLLRGIVAFHEGHRPEARRRLGSVQAALQELKVSEELVEEVMANGCSRQDALGALRLFPGDLSTAVRHALNRKSERERLAREEEERFRKEKRYGKTVSGAKVNHGMVTSLKALGCPEEYILLALRQTDNDLDGAVDLLTTRRDVLEATMMSELQEKSAREQSSSPTEANGASSASGGEEGPSTSSAMNAEDAAKAEEAKAKAAEARAARREAKQRMIQDTGNSLGSLDDHLNLDISEDEELLKKYLKYLEA